MTWSVRRLGRIPAHARAGWWAMRGLRRARRHVQRHGLAGTAVPPPPSLPSYAARGVRAALRLQPHTCLQEALVLQRWYAAHGDPRDVVIGVLRAQQQVKAHAWLHGDPRPANDGFCEIARVRP